MSTLIQQSFQKKKKKSANKLKGKKKGIFFERYVCTGYRVFLFPSPPPFFCLYSSLFLLLPLFSGEMGTRRTFATPDTSNVYLFQSHRERKKKRKEKKKKGQKKKILKTKYGISKNKNQNSIKKQSKKKIKILEKSGFFLLLYCFVP